MTDKQILKAVVEMACEELGNWMSCPKDKDFNDCEKTDCTSCRQRYFEEKIDETQVKRHVLIVLGYGYTTPMELKSAMIHERNWKHPVSKIWYALSTLKREGKVKSKLIRGTDKRKRYKEYYKKFKEQSNDN